MANERKPPRDAMSQRHVSNFVRALGDSVPAGSRDAALFTLAADDYGRGSNGRDLSMDLLNPALYASIAATLGSNWIAPDGSQGFVDALVRGLPSEAFIEAAGATSRSGPSPAPQSPAPSPVPRRIAPRSPPSPFLQQVQQAMPSPEGRNRYSRRLDAPPRRLTEEEQRAENQRLYGNPDGPPSRNERSGSFRGGPLPVRRTQAQSEEITVPRRRLPREGPER